MTTERSPSPALRWLGAFLAGLGLAAAAAYALNELLGPASSGLPGAWKATPAATATLVAAPFVAAIVTALLGAGSPRAPQLPVAIEAAAAAPPPPPDRGEAALRLLALMQQE